MTAEIPPEPRRDGEVEELVENMLACLDKLSENINADDEASRRALQAAYGAESYGKRVEEVVSE